MLAFRITAPVLDIAARLATATVPVGQIALARFLVRGIVMLPVMWPWACRSAFRRDRRRC
jgi:hypothetical protein